MAGTYRFAADGVEIRSGGLEGTLPRALITRSAETDSFFNIAYGREVRIWIPKRLLTDEDIRRLRAWIADGKGVTERG